MKCNKIPYTYVYACIRLTSTTETVKHLTEMTLTATTKQQTHSYWIGVDESCANKVKREGKN